MCGRSSTYFDAVRPAGPVSPAARAMSAPGDGGGAVVPPAAEGPRGIRKTAAKGPLSRGPPTRDWGPYLWAVLRSAGAMWRGAYRARSFCAFVPLPLLVAFFVVPLPASFHVEFSVGGVG